MTSVEQKQIGKVEEKKTSLRVEQKDRDGRVYEWDAILAASIHIHNPSVAKLKRWVKEDGTEYFVLALSNSNESNQATIFFLRDELQALRELLGSA